MQDHLQSGTQQRHLPVLSARFITALILGLLGMAASVATIYAAPFQGAQTLACGVKALDCSKALTSQFSKVAGIPLGVFGLLYFAFWTLNLRAFQRTHDPVFRFAFSYVTLLGAIVSLTMGSIMFLVLKAPCLYCLITHSSNLLSLGLLWPLMSWRLRFRATADHVYHLITLGFVSLLAATTLFFANETRIAQAQLRAKSEAVW